MKIPDSIDERQKMFEFKERPVVAGILLDFLLDVLLMPYRFRKIILLSHVFCNIFKNHYYNYVFKFLNI